MGASYSKEEESTQIENAVEPISVDGDGTYDTDYENYRLVEMLRVQEEARELFKNKNKDYGDSFSSYGVVGVLVRLGDKIQRASTITKNGVSAVNTESLRDTLIDLANYACMGVMLLDETSEV